MRKRLMKVEAAFMSKLFTLDRAENSIMQTISIAVSAILIAAGLTTAPGIINNARDNNAKTDLANVAYAQELYSAGYTDDVEGGSLLAPGNPNPQTSSADGVTVGAYASTLDELMESGALKILLYKKERVALNVNTERSQYIAGVLSDTGKRFYRTGTTGHIYLGYDSIPDTWGIPDPLTGITLPGGGGGTPTIPDADKYSVGQAPMTASVIQDPALNITFPWNSASGKLDPHTLLSANATLTGTSDLGSGITSYTYSLPNSFTTNIYLNDGTVIGAANASSLNASALAMTDLSQVSFSGLTMNQFTDWRVFYQIQQQGAYGIINLGGEQLKFNVYYQAPYFGDAVTFNDPATVTNGEGVLVGSIPRVFGYGTPWLSDTALDNTFRANMFTDLPSGFPYTLWMQEDVNADFYYSPDGTEAGYVLDASDVSMRVGVDFRLNQDYVFGQPRATYGTTLNGTNLTSNHQGKWKIVIDDYMGSPLTYTFDSPDTYIWTQ